MYAKPGGECTRRRESKSVPSKLLTNSLLLAPLRPARSNTQVEPFNLGRNRMNTRDGIKIGLDTGEFVSLGYLEDLTDAELLRRPHPACNHINWQVGHLIAAEHMMIEKVAPGSMPALPASFAEKYAKETATCDDASKFTTKSELLD